MKNLNDKGYALVLVVVIVALVITLTSTMLFTLNTEIRLNLGMEEKERANYLAQAGIEHALMLIEQNPTLPSLPGVQTLDLPGSNEIYTYTITKLTATEISAIGEIKEGVLTKQSATIAAVIDSNGKVTIKE